MKVLYKYRALGERTNEIIQKGKIWLAKPESLNDPNECRFEAPEPAQVRKVAEETKTHQLSGFITSAHTAHTSGENFFTLRGRSINRLLSRIKKASNLDAKYKIANNFLRDVGATGFSDPYDQPNSIDKTMKKVGIFSLSEDPLNMLMWSHYGNSHQGLAIGFSTSEGSRLADPKCCQAVRYQDGAKTFNFSGGRLTGVAYYRSDDGTLRAEGYVQIEDEQIQNVLFTKTEAWAYEREWRYFEPQFGEYDHPGKIIEVIFGLRMSLEQQREFASLCREHIPNEVQFRKVVRPDGAQNLELQDAAV